MQTPGTRYVGRCTHCGNKEHEVTVYLCQWSDGRFSVERLCDTCAPTWGHALKDLGCTLTPEPPTRSGAAPGGLVTVASAPPLLHARL